MNHTNPLLIYDGECGFCRKWVERWKKITRDRVEYRPMPGGTCAVGEGAHGACAQAVRLIAPDGTEYHAAHAVFRLLAYGGRRGLLWYYEHAPGFAWVSEQVYRFIAARRRSY